MPLLAHADLDEVRAALLAEVGGNVASCGALCTRVLLRTGVNVMSPRPDQRTDPAAVDKVLAALADLGHRI